MAETLISPGVLARENDQSFVTSQPAERGAAIIGPTVLGPVERPTLISSFSSYQAIFGGALQSGSGEYTYLTSIAANQYFQNGGTSLLVTRVTSGSFTSATSSLITNTNDIVGGAQASGSLAIVNSFGESAEDEFRVVVNGNTSRFVAQDPAGGIPVDNPPLYFLSTGTTTAAYIDNLVAKIDSVGIGVNTDDYTSNIGITSSAIGTSGNNITALTGSASTFSTVLTLQGGIAGSGSTSAFELETISEGELMNTGTASLSNGALTSGSANNVRWEIASTNTSSGVFSLLIRRGDDTDNNKVVLESYNNISLDPFASNYISRAIGDISTTLVTEGADTFLQESGSFPNISNYVRVKEVTSPTPYYFNNDGSAKAEFTGSIPEVGSGSFNGSFNGALGSAIPTGRAANFYENINATDTQGLVGGDYNNAIALLANQDDYQFNVISVPGLSNQHHAFQVTSVMNNSISRGDSIAVIDLVGYNQQINTVVNAASGIDNSYTATYWPWLQTVDPNSGMLVYIPASTFIPGVYAFTDASSDPWFAPAGITRGGMGQVVRAERRLTSTNRDTLYEANVNPIATFPSQGVVVFGQKTLQKAATALDRINVRRLLITLKDYISQIADNLVFEQNTIATRQNFLTQVNPYLESVQQRQGLYAFKVVMDETNNTPDVIDRNELIGQIFLQPTKTAEFIILDFNVLPTGATFPA
jgi:phage tail sheath protein FI